VSVHDHTGGFDAWNSSDGLLETVLIHACEGSGALGGFV